MRAMHASMKIRASALEAASAASRRLITSFSRARSAISSGSRVLRGGRLPVAARMICSSSAASPG